VYYNVTETKTDIDHFNQSSCPCQSAVVLYGDTPVCVEYIQVFR
jgi:hypothetical protein